MDYSYHEALMAANSLKVHLRHPDLRGSEVLAAAHISAIIHEELLGARKINQVIQSKEF